MTTAGRLATNLRTLVEHQLESLERSLLPGWQFPRVIAGHAVGADVRADLAFTLGHLADGGATTLSGWEIEAIIATVIRPIDGAGTHTFFSYRVAETLERYGPIDDNRLLEGWTGDETANIATACDSTDWLSLLDEQVLPANYAAVLARCELARRRLGLDVDPEVVADLLGRADALLARNPLGFLDDDPKGGGRYDIYSVDLYLFCEPFADRLPTWNRGIDSVLDLVEHTVGDDGTAVSWGRSTGLLGLCHTIELAALVLHDDRIERDTSRWLRLAAVAVDHLPRWFEDGLTTAHQGRSPYGYRGPERRLQLTLDALGKLAWAATRLARAVPGATDDEVAASSAPIAVGERWIDFEARRALGVWAVDTPHLRFTLPVVGTPWSDYLPTPRQPGRFETPVDRPLGVGTPMVHQAGRWHAGAGTPIAVSAEPGRLTAQYDHFPPMGGLDAGGEPLAGHRRVRWELDRRTIRVHEHLRFERVPDGVSLQVCETEHQPLVFTATTDHPHTTASIDTGGMKEWRSFWGELPRVHQIDLEPATEVQFEWSMTPVLRVATDAGHHWYHRSLYDPMAPWVSSRSMHRPHWERADGLDRLRNLDVYHLHWPEWVFDTDADAARRFVALLQAADVRLVWTQHNLYPHREGDFADVYAVMAAGADGVIHHSDWGRDRALAERPYRDGALHAVLPHGHWADLVAPVDDPAAERTRAEHELGLDPCALRIGIVGAPRPGKDTLGFIEAFHRSRRQDLQLVVLSLDPGEPGEPGDAEALTLPDDPRIRAQPYEFVDREVWDRRLAAIDVVAFPFRPDARQLTTGVFADAIGAGLPGLVTSWGYLTEVLGAAGIPMGDTSAAWTAAVDGLTEEVVTAAGGASAALRTRYDWSRIAEETRTFIEDVAALRA